MKKNAHQKQKGSQRPSQIKSVCTNFFFQLPYNRLPEGISERKPWVNCSECLSHHHSVIHVSHLASTPMRTGLPWPRLNCGYIMRVFNWWNICRIRFFSWTAGTKWFFLRNSERQATMYIQTSKINNPKTIRWLGIGREYGYPKRSELMTTE